MVLFVTVSLLVLSSAQSCRDCHGRQLGACTALESSTDMGWSDTWSFLARIWTDPNRPDFIRWQIVGKALGIVVNVGLGVYLNLTIKSMTNALAALDTSAFRVAFKRFLCVALCFLPQRWFDIWDYWCITIKWRGFLVSSGLDQFFQNDNYYHVAQKYRDLDDAGLRISRDMTDFVEDSFEVIDDWFKKALKVGMHGWLLYSIQPSWCLVTVSYAVLGTSALLWTFAGTLTEKRMVRIETASLFMKTMVQVNEYDESIAFSKAHDREKAVCFRKFHRYQDSLWDNGSAEILPALCYYLLVKLSSGLPYFMAAWVFLDPSFGTTMTMGDLSSAVRSTNTIMEAVLIKSREIQRIARVKAKTSRILELERAMNRLDADKEKELDQLPRTKTTDSSKFQINIKNVTVSTPNGHVLVKDLDLKIPRGMSVLIMGPSGCGKSSVLRSILGLWKPGAGSIEIPDRDNAMFLPQSVYIPDCQKEKNTLRSQVLFPKDDPMIEDSAVKDVLEQVNLGKLLGPDGVRTADNWRSRLSGGEKQRLAMSRLLLAKPPLAFLDEASSALDFENERLLYEALKSRGATYVSVAHKLSLRKYHSHILDLKLGGDWTFYESPEYHRELKQH